jgi:NADP-dependent 3-hydroxy acid dehydrogenase YdfG
MTSWHSTKQIRLESVGKSHIIWELKSRTHVPLLSVKVTRAVLPYFREQRSGVILNIGSHVGRFARAAFSGYCSSKFAVEGESYNVSEAIKPS